MALRRVATLLTLSFIVCATPIDLGPSSAMHVIPLGKRSGGRSDPALYARKAEAKYAALHANFERNTGQSLRGGSNASLARRKSGDDESTVAFVSNDPIPTFYYAIIEVGTPPVMIHTDLDTGSYDFWLTAKNCQGDGGQPCVAPESERYDPAASSTSSYRGGSDWKIAYGDGSTSSGSIYQDSVSLAGHSVVYQPFALATHTGTGLNSLFGMGFKAIASEVWQDLGVSSFFDNLLHSPAGQALKAPMFAMKIDGSDGELALGGSNNAKYKGPITWLDVDVGSQGGAANVGWWLAPLDGFYKSGSTERLGGARSVLIDSGTTGIIVDPQTAEQYYNDPRAYRIDDTTWAIPCDGSYGGSFTFGGKAFPIKGLAMVGNKHVVASQRRGSEYCESFLYTTPNYSKGFSMWILGDSFMEGVYTIFDVGGLKIGFADLADVK